MFISQAIETLQDEAVLAAEYGDDVVEFNEAMRCTPRLGLRRELVVVFS
jgi:hypothetical protein